MKVVGPGKVHVFDPADEAPHQPGPDSLWQESCAFYVWDPTSQVYMFLRVSHEPNRGSGFSTTWLNVWTPTFIYKHADDMVPMTAVDRGEKSLSSGTNFCRYEYDGTHRWTVDSPDVQINMAMRDYHPGFGYFAASSGALVDEVCPHHIEATGVASGTVTIKGQSYSVAGTGWRDHSWGKRNWIGILAHRGYMAMFGRDFNFFALTLVGLDGNMAKFGLVIRVDTVEMNNDFEIVAYMGEDGVSNCGGTVSVRLDGKTHVLVYELIGKSAVTMHQGFAICDGICKVTMDGREGFGYSETSNRAQGGTAKPHVFPHSRGILENGIYPV